MNRRKACISIFLSVMLFVSICLPANVFSTENNVNTKIDREADLVFLEEQLANQLNEISDTDVTVTNEVYSSDSELTDEILRDPKAYQEWKSGYLSSKANGIFNLQALSSNYMENEFVAAQVNYGGRFNIGTTGGNPDTNLDDYKMLLYGWPYGTTSVTTVQIDNNNYLFDTQNVVKNEDGTQMIASMTFDEFGIIVKQILSFDMNMNTSREDMVKINYEITNNSSNSHDVGIRIMMDTMLGDNDGAPFRIPGYGNVTTEVEIGGAYIPQYWQAFDNLDNPTTVASGKLYNSFNEKPDKVQFVSWPDIWGTQWDYPVTLGKGITHDSAVALYYNPKTMNPGTTNNVATYYGIGNFATLDDPEGLFVGVAAPQALTVNPNTSNYYSNPYIITCYIRNNSGETIQNAVATLNLPDSNELRIPVPGNKVIHIGDIAPGAEKVIAYSVLAASQSVDKTLDYNINITADNYDTKTIPMSITLPKTTGIENGSITLNKTSLNLITNQTEILRAVLTNIFGSVTWSSNKPSVAKVNSNGLVTAISPGTAIITASAGGKSAICTVTVAGSPITLNSISISPSTASISINEIKTLSVIFDPSNTSNKQIKSWTSSRPDVATVYGGRVTGKKVGTTVITAIAQDGNKKATSTITVIEPEPTLNLGDGVEFEQRVPGPSINFGGHNFPLFNINVGAEVKLGNTVKLVYDPVKDKFVAYFGDMKEKTGTNDKNPDGTLTEAAKQLRRDTYREIKDLMSMVGRQTNRDFYNSYRRFVAKSSPWSVTGNKTVFGYVEFVYSNGSYVLSGGEVCALFEAGVEFKYNFPPAPVVYLKFGINGSLQTGLKLKLRTSGVLDSGLDVFGKVEGKLKPSIGVGGDILVAKVEGGLEGSVKSVIQLPVNNSTFTPPRDLEVSLSGNLYLKYKAFVFINGKLTYPLGTYKVYPQNSTRTNALMAINSDSMELIPRDYLNTKKFTANDGVTNFNARAIASSYDNYQTTNIMTNTYPYGEPQIISLNNNQYLLAFIGDIGSRSSENRTGLYYSLFNGSEWSSPVLVHDDGTADFSPSIINNGNDVYVAWQNIESVLNEGAALEDYSRNSGIAVAKFNGYTFDTPQSLTTPDNLFDSAPVITAGSGQAAVVWINNSENDVLNLSGTNSIYRSILSDGKWSQAVPVVDDAGYISQLSSAFNGLDNIIVYSKDVDNDLESMTDRELFLVKGSGSPIAITNNDVPDTNAVLAVTSGATSLYWSSGEDIYYSESIENIIPVRVGKSVDGVFKVFSGELSKAIIWEQSMGYSSELFGMFYDNGEWGAPAQITNEGNRIRELSGCFGDDGNIYLSYISAVINTVEDGMDIDPTGDAALCVTKLTPSCNLSFESNISYDKRQILPNGVVTLGAYVENLGQVSVPGFSVVLSDEAGIISTTAINTPLASGAGAYVDIPYTLPDILVKHQLTLSIEPIESVDYDLSNNTAAVTIGDATIDVMKPVITGMGNRRTITATITNTGYAPSEPLTVNLYTNSTDTPPIYTQTVVSIPAQASRIVEFTLPITNDSFINGDFEVYVGVNDGERELFNCEVMRRPERSNSLTISGAAQVGNIVLFNIDNNLATDVNGTILISSKNDYDNQMSQSIALGSLGSQSIQLDITSLQEEDALSIRVLGEDDTVISNIVNVFSNGAVQIDSPFAIPEAGTYINSVLVTLYCVDPDAKIYYTVDGSIPTITNGTEYKGAFTVTSTSVINSIAVKEGMIDSEVTSVLYKINIVPSYVRIEPEVINLKNIDKGNRNITVYITFPDSLSLNDIKLDTIRINDNIVPVTDTKYGYVENPISDYDGDGRLEFMFKLDAAQLKEMLVQGENDITLTGEIGSNSFYWNGTLHAIEPPNNNKGQ